jgi:Ca2+-binding EF-hand superfamily protein
MFNPSNLFNNMDGRRNGYIVINDILELFDKVDLKEKLTESQLGFLFYHGTKNNCGKMFYKDFLKIVLPTSCTELQSLCLRR